MDFTKLYRQTYSFERQTLQLDEQVDGFSELDVESLAEKLEDMSDKLKKKYATLKKKHSD